MKKVITMAMALTLVANSGVGMLPELTNGEQTGIVANAQTFGNFSYSLNANNTVKITKYNGKESNVTIPSTINGKTVTSIGKDAFKENKYVTNVTIPSSVTSIEDYAFCLCSKITDIIIPGGVEYIGDYVFTECKNLSNIYVDSNNKKYISDNGVLFSKDKTKLIKYPQGNIREIYTIPNTVTSIGDNAFDYCSNLASIKIPNSVTSIGKSAFFDCSSLASITIPNSVTSIEDYAFFHCSSLASITIPNSVTSIGKSAFFDCSSLASITIPNSVTSIDENAFSYCSNLASITIPNSVTSIGNYAFEECPNILFKCHQGYSKENILKQYGKVTYTHFYSDKWTVDKKPTCTSTGIKSHHCKVCGEKKDITNVPKTAHSYVKVKTVKPTYTSKGYTLYKCKVCGVTARFNIKNPLARTSIAKAKISKIAPKTYTGKQIKPTIKVTYGTATLKNGKDYTIKFGKNKIGTGRLTIIGKGKYKGTVTKTFKINPKKPTVKLIKGNKGKFTVKFNKRPEASKYQLQVSDNKKFNGSVLTSIKTLKKTFTGFKGQTYYVRVRAIKTIGKKSYISSWSAVKKIKI